MDETQVTRFCLPYLIGSTIDKGHLEEGVIMSTVVVLRPSGEFLVSGHQRRCNVMGKEISLGIDMKKLNNIFIAHNPSTAGFGKRLGGNYFPEIVGIVMPISSNLLAF